jgi:hypothetical protein
MWMYLANSGSGAMRSETHWALLMQLRMQSVAQYSYHVGSRGEGLEEVGLRHEIVNPSIRTYSLIIQALEPPGWSAQ